MIKNFAFCLNDKYVDFCYVTMLSIIKNKNPNDKLTFHLLTDYFSKQDEEKFKSLVEKSNDEVKVYIIDKKRFDGFNMNFSVYVWFRILITEVVDKSVSRVLYLDCDIIVNSNLDYLFNLDFNDNAIAAVIDRESFNSLTFERLKYPSEKHYICAGTLLINVDYWRENKITDKVYNYGKKYPVESIFAEQDAINYICQDSKIMLPLRFGVINNFFSASHRYDKHQVMEAMDYPEIVHYAGNSPWKYPSNHHFHKKLWWNNFKRANLGPNNIKYNYVKSMIFYYLKILKFNITNFKSYPYPKPRTISKREVLENLK